MDFAGYGKQIEVETLVVAVAAVVVAGVLGFGATGPIAVMLGWLEEQLLLMGLPVVVVADSPPASKEEFQFLLCLRSHHDKLIFTSIVSNC